MKDMTKKQMKKEKRLVPLLQDNKRVAERLSKLEEENVENEKKIKFCTLKKVMLVNFVYCCNLCT